jgi:hypothetical protein
MGLSVLLTINHFYLPLYLSGFIKFSSKEQWQAAQSMIGG